MNTGRLEALSDGIFAFVATLLALDVRVPELPAHEASTRLLIEYAWLAPKLLSYTLAFSFVAVWWVSHHTFFHALHRLSRRLIWLNWTFLLFFCLLPATTSLLGSYPKLPWGIVPFGFLSTACGLSNIGMRLVATRDGLWREHVNVNLRRHSVYRSMISPAAYLIGACLAFIDARLTWAIYIGLPLFYVLPGKLDRAIESRTLS